MAFPDYSNVVVNLSHLAVDILVFVATEILVRLIFAGRNATRRKIPLLFAQGALLLASSALLVFFHHFPYLLALVSLFIFIRLIVLVCERTEPVNTAISKPLRYSPEVDEIRSEGVVQPQYCLENQQNVGGKLVGSSAFPFQPTAGRILQKPSNSLGASNLNWRRATGRGDKPLQSGIPQCKAKDASNTPFHQPSSWIFPGTSLRAPTFSNFGLKSLACDQLRRSPLTSGLTQTSSTWVESPHREHDSDLSFYQHPSLGYFTSLLNFRKPSSTPPGLINAGNTCFLNSILQCLTWTAGFLEVLPLVGPTGGDHSVFVQNLCAVVHQCHVLPDGVSKFDPINPSDLLTSLSKLAPHLVVNSESGHYQSQQDAAECLLWILDFLHGVLWQQSDGRSGQSRPHLSTVEVAALAREKKAYLMELEGANSDDIPSFRHSLTGLSEVDWELHWQRNSSTLYQLFLGQLMEIRECQLCKTMSVNVEYFTVLPLPVPRPGVGVGSATHRYQLQDCFGLFSQVEDLVQANMLHCSCTLSLKNKLTSLAPGKRLALLSKSPQRLVIQLTRFSYDSIKKESTKNSTLVTFPLTLDLHPHTMQAKLNSNFQMMTTCVYHLCALCAHTGAQSTSFGHYVAYCKAANGEWYYYSDKNVTHIANIATAVNSTFVLQNTYLLFYALQD